MNTIGSQHLSIANVIDDNVIDIAAIAVDTLAQDSNPPNISSDSGDEFQFGQFSNV
jgi:hypothetical protein